MGRFQTSHISPPFINRLESSVRVISSFICTYIDNYNNEDVYDDDDDSSKSLGLW